MLRLWTGIGMIAAVLATAGGCCFRGGPPGRFRNTECGDCEVVRPGLRGRVAACREAHACRQAGDECSEPCAESSCPPYRGPHCGPLSFLFSLFRCGVYCDGGCGGGGCGERYWGEWGNSPDGCDDCGGGGGHTGRTGRTSRSHVYDDYEMPATSVRGSGCKNCGQGDVAARSSRLPAPYVAKSSGHAQRIVSQSDRVVRPARAAGTAEQVAEEVAEPNQAKVQR